MKTIARTLALAATMAATFSTTAAAQLGAPAPQRSSIAGLNLGVFLNGSAIEMAESNTTESGGGGSVHLGYGVSENASVFLRVNTATIRSSDIPGGGSYTMAHADIGVRYSFLGSSSVVRPFVQGAFNGRAVMIDEGIAGTLDARGRGLSAGAGLEYFFSPTVAVEAGFSYSVGRFDEGRLNGGDWVDFEGEGLRATSARVDLGISLHP